MMHARYRWFLASYRTNAVTTARFRESTLPAIGIRTIVSTTLSSTGGKPCRSLPISSTNRSGNKNVA